MVDLSVVWWVLVRGALGLLVACFDYGLAVLLVIDCVSVVIDVNSVVYMVIYLIVVLRLFGLFAWFVIGL